MKDLERALRHSVDPKLVSTIIKQLAEYAASEISIAEIDKADNNGDISLLICIGKMKAKTWTC